jgi:polysaccharide deacetylase family protein (PEP-CTERM system associated)
LTDPSPLRHVLTIDLEDWFHALEPDPARWHGFSRRAEVGTRLLLDLLDEHGATATFFVLGDVAAHAGALVREVAARGHEIGSHGSLHRFITRQTPAEFRADLAASIARLEDLVSRPVRAFRAPYFSITRRSLWALDILRDEGIRHDSSIFPVVNHRYGIPDAEPRPHQIRPGLTEWPISVLATPAGNLPFSGGVYFRWLPMAFIERAFAAFEARRQRVIFYLHPWELDPDHPRHPVAPLLFLRHYGRLRGTASRLGRLLARHRFASLAEVA